MVGHSWMKQFIQSHGRQGIFTGVAPPHLSRSSPRAAGLLALSSETLIARAQSESAGLDCSRSGDRKRFQADDLQSYDVRSDHVLSDASRGRSFGRITAITLS
jgi:hypothetical protein